MTASSIYRAAPFRFPPRASTHTRPPSKRICYSQQTHRTNQLPQPASQPTPSSQGIFSLRQDDRERHTHIHSQKPSSFLSGRIHNGAQNATLSEEHSVTHRSQVCRTQNGSAEICVEEQERLQNWGCIECDSITCTDVCLYNQSSPGTCHHLLMTKIQSVRHMFGEWVNLMLTLHLGDPRSPNSKRISLHYLLPISSYVWGLLFMVFVIEQEVESHPKPSHLLN